MFFKKKVKKEADIVLVKKVMTAFSGIYAELLKENNIPFMVRQEGAGGYLKVVTGGLLVPDCFYVKAHDYEKALELYNAFIETEVEEN